MIAWRHRHPGIRLAPAPLFIGLLGLGACGWPSPDSFDTPTPGGVEATPTPGAEPTPTPSGAPTPTPTGAPTPTGSPVTGTPSPPTPTPSPTPSPTPTDLPPWTPTGRDCVVLDPGSPEVKGRCETEDAIGRWPFPPELSFSAVNSAGDLNGDGMEELVLSLRDPGNQNVVGGAVLLHYGRGEPVDLRVPSASFSRVGDAGSLQVAVGVGDVNGDHYDDLVIGGPGLGSLGVAGAGEVYLLCGGAEPLAGGELGPHRAAVTFTTDLPEGGVGRSAAGVGDLNGDGLGDVAIAALGSEVVPEAVYVFYGQVAWCLAQGAVLQAEEADLIIVGGGAEELGAALRGVGDVDGDHRGELLLGAPSWGPGRSGAAYLVFSEDYPPRTTLDLTEAGTVALAFRAIGTSDSLGVDVDAGDVNADGIPDLMIGAPGRALDGGEGAVYLITELERPQGLLERSVEAGAPILVSNPGTSGRFGQSLRSLGDLDGDGRVEFIVGDPKGTGPGAVWLFSMRGEGALSWTTSYPGAKNGDGFGDHLGRADLDGDGIPEVAIAAPGAGADDTGLLYLFSTVPVAEGD